MKTHAEPDETSTLALSRSIDTLLAEHVLYGHSPVETARALCLTVAWMVVRASRQGLGTISEVKATAIEDVAHMIDLVAKLAPAASRAEIDSEDDGMSARATVSYTGRA